MAKYTILHKVPNGYNQVAVVESKDIIDSFKMAQNDFNPDYAELGVRSTMVGDVIIDSNDVPFIIQGMGFKRARFHFGNIKPIASI
jgi:hypothetical protein